MFNKQARRRRWSAMIAATLAGGTLFGTCETRLHDSIVDGTKLFLYSLFDADNLVIDFGDGNGGS